MKFEAFDTYDDMMAAISRNVERADELIFGFQRNIRPGDFCILPTDYGFPVFAKILDFPESYPADKTNDPAWLFMFTKSFSEACPEGELGDQHRAVLLPIPRDRFEAARESGWDREICRMVYALALKTYWPEISAAGKQ